LQLQFNDRVALSSCNRPVIKLKPVTSSLLHPDVAALTFKWVMSIMFTCQLSTHDATLPQTAGTGLEP
ncbi:MAG: hypothetical protein ACTMK5_19020, partial [Pseudomonas helleri]